MKVVEVKTKKEKKKFLEFRTQIYKENPMFIDNDLFVLKELFFGKSSFTYITLFFLLIPTKNSLVIFDVEVFSMTVKKKFTKISMCDIRDRNKKKIFTLKAHIK